VYAAAGGAAGTDSVDLSNTYLAWARENFSLNGFSAQLLTRDFKNREENANNLIRADALEFVEKAATLKKRWDIIVLDPPSFSNSKKMTGDFDLQRDKVPLVRSCIELLNPGGKLFLSINTQKLKNAAGVAVDLSSVSDKLRVTDLTGRLTDEDFRGKKVPLSFLIQI
jgi:23S rRNA G2069 N7-methylase RlmK/C1962 C5-methylase RlmI